MFISLVPGACVTTDGDSVSNVSRSETGRGGLPGHQDVDDDHGTNQDQSDTSDCR